MGMSGGGGHGTMHMESDVTRPQLVAVTLLTLLAWLAAILRRRVVDRWRRVHRRPTPASETALEIAIDGDDPLAAEFTDEMQLALSRLPQELRETLLLVVVSELTHQETADLLAVPLGTVLSRVSRARKRLREYLLATVRG